MSVGSGRRADLEIAINDAKSLGIDDIGKRRTAIIDAVKAQKKGILDITPSEAQQFPSVAKSDIRNESPETIWFSQNKYLETQIGVPRIPILIECLHSVKPNKEEIRNGKLELLDRYEIGTDAISKRVAKLTGGSLLMAKKSRVFGDLNRAGYKRGDGEALEYSASGRAALYMGVRKVLLAQDRLNTDEKLEEEFTRVSIHGMKGNDDFAFAIAGSNDPAPQQFLEGFAKRLTASLLEVGITDKVVIAKKEDPKTVKYSGLPNISNFRKSPKKFENFQHPDFGDKFNTIQLEIGKKFRQNPEIIESVSVAIANALKPNLTDVKDN